MFGGGDASCHRPRRPRDGTRHVIVFEGGDGRSQGNVSGVGGIARDVGGDADEVRFRDVAVVS